jgi:hypothetical protein
MAPLMLAAVLSMARLQAQSGAQAGALTNSDVVRLLSLGVSDRTVLAVIQEAKQRQFDGTADSINALKAAGVPEAIIAAIQRVPASSVEDAGRLDRQKFDKVSAAGKALRDAVGGTSATLGQIDRLLQAFKAEVTSAKDKATTQAERSLATTYALAQLQFETGLSQMIVPQRVETWAKARATLDEAEKAYSTK